MPAPRADVEIYFFGGYFSADFRTISVRWSLIFIGSEFSSTAIALQTSACFFASRRSIVSVPSAYPLRTTRVPNPRQPAGYASVSTRLPEPSAYRTFRSGLSIFSVRHRAVRYFRMSASRFFCTISLFSEGFFARCPRAAWL